jgi:hypothetical protein
LFVSYYSAGILGLAPGAAFDSSTLSPKQEICPSHCFLPIQFMYCNVIINAFQGGYLRVQRSRQQTQFQRKVRDQCYKPDSNSLIRQACSPLETNYPVSLFMGMTCRGCEGSVQTPSNFSP